MYTPWSPGERASCPPPRAGTPSFPGSVAVRRGSNGQLLDMNTPARIMFAGTPGFALEALRTLHAAGYSVAAVITQPDRAAGRGRKLTASPVKQWAQGAELRLSQPGHWDDALIGRLRELGADLMVVAAYGAILPAAALEVCRLGAVNIHASLLPRWRGASPVAAAILAGDRDTGVTLMRMDAGLDTGPLLAAERTRIEPHETTGELEARLAQMGAGLLLEHLPEILGEQLQAARQSDALASYAPRISKQQGRIDWSMTAAELARRVRAFDPWPVAHALWRNQPLRLWGARVLPGPAQAPGRVLSVTGEGIDLATVSGVLRVQEIQVPGRRRLPAAEAARGAPLAGARLA